MSSLTERITKMLIEKHAVFENDENNSNEDNKPKKINKRETNRKILNLLSWLPYKDLNKEIFEVNKKH